MHNANIIILHNYKFIGELKMGSHSERDELYPVQIENRHLKETINNLRETLEKMQIEKKDSVQKAIAGANSEIIQLKETIITLRETMQQNKNTSEEEIQEIERNNRDEVNHLQQTIVNLRQQLEKPDAKH